MQYVCIDCGIEAHIWTDPVGGSLECRKCNKSMERNESIFWCKRYKDWHRIDDVVRMKLDKKSVMTERVCKGCAKKFAKRLADKYGKEKAKKMLKRIIIRETG